MLSKREFDLGLKFTSQEAAFTCCILSNAITLALFVCRWVWVSDDIGPGMMIMFAAMLSACNSFRSALLF